MVLWYDVNMSYHTHWCFVAFQSKHTHVFSLRSGACFQFAFRLSYLSRFRSSSPLLAPCTFERRSTHSRRRGGYAKAIGKGVEFRATYRLNVTDVSSYKSNGQKRVHPEGTRPKPGTLIFAIQKSPTRVTLKPLPASNLNCHFVACVSLGV